MGGVFVLAIYAYSELVYLIFICIAIVGLTIYYRKSIIKMYAEIFNELGINKYVIQIKNLKKYKEPIYKVSILFSALTRMFPKPTFAP